MRKLKNDDTEKSLNEVEMMASISVEIKEYSKKCIQDSAKEYPNVFLLINEKSIETVSDRYNDVVNLKVLLKSKLLKTNRGAARIFGKPNYTEKQGALSSTYDNTTFSNF